MIDATYVLPIRTSAIDEELIADLRSYFSILNPHVELLVVDGSPAEVFEAHHDAWRHVVQQHVPPDGDLRFSNGKVNGVLTGLRLATFDKTVIADDDVRYDLPTLRRVVELLDSGEIVRPQNYFDPRPWHARCDTARTLVHRSLGHDMPGTLGVRRCALRRSPAYDGDVLFENLELLRTVRADGGTELAPHDLFVRRVPPTTRQFWSQRVRQAYDEFARPHLLAIELAIAPTSLLLAARGRFDVLGAVIIGVPMLLAAIGRTRGRGAAVFGVDGVVLAPMWVAERAITSWLAVIERIRFGGVRYAGRVVSRAAHSARALDARSHV